MGWFSNPDAQRLTPYDLESGEWISLSDAKSEWFLTSDDLKMQLQVGSFGGGVGAGRATTYYRTNFVMKAAMRKFGDDGLRKKQEARKKRLAKKEDAVAAAQTARANLAAAAAAAAAPETPLDKAAAAAAAKEVAVLRKAVTKMVKKAQGFQQKSDRPAKWRVELPLISAAHFAALCGRPNDPTLTSFVKAGAFCSEDMAATALFACTEEQLPSKKFAMRGVSVRVCEKVTLKFKPSDGTLSVAGDAEVHCDDDGIGMHRMYPNMGSFLVAQPAQRCFF